MITELTHAVPRAPRPLGQRIAWIGGLFVAVVVALAAIDIVRGHLAAVEESGGQLNSQAMIIAEQTARSMQAVDLVLRHIADQHRSGIIAMASAQQMHAYLASQAVGLAQIEGLVVIDADARVRATSHGNAVRDATSDAGATAVGVAAFDALRRDRHRDVIVGPSRRSSDGAGPWVFPIVRRLETATGEFAGVVAAQGRVEYFQKFYRDVRSVDGTKINLMHLDGTLMAREPVVESALGQHFALFDSLLADHGAAPANSPLRVISPLDGVKRFGALAPVAGYPLAVVVTRDVALALAPWRAQTAGTVARTLALSLLAAMLMALLQRQWVRLDKTRASLEVSRERFALAVAGSDDGVWDFDYTTGEAFASQRARQIMGLPLQPEVQALDEWVARLPIHPEDRPLRQAAIESHLAGHTPHYEGEWRIVHGDGSHRWVRVRGVCVRDAAGKPLRMAGSVSDIDARRRAEDALRQSEERYALAVAGSDDGVWDWDYVSGLAFESPRARELQGLPLAPEVQPLADVVASLRVHPEDAMRRAEAIQAHLAGETPAYECEYRVQHADGSERWIRVRALCSRDAAGNPCRMAGSVSDIDSRKRAEEALRRSEERFALAVDGSNDGILDWNIVDDSMYVSERALRIVGIDASATVRTRGDWAALLMPRLHADDAQRLADELRGMAGVHRQAHDGEYRVRHADGQYRWTRFRGMSVRDAGGRPIRWAGSVSDIDAAKKVEEALRRSEERYQLAVAGSNEGLWDWDLASDQLFLSPRNQELLWLEPAEPQRPRREWIALTHYHPDDVGTVRAAISAHLRGATQHFKVEYRLRHHSGHWHWYRQRGVAVRDALGRPTRMAGSMEDITDRKNADADRERLEAQLRQAQKLEAIGTLAGGIAHDFNNILAAILGYGEMAQKSAAEGTALRRHLDAAISAAMRAKSLVERILAFSRSGMGERIAVDAQAIVSEALDGVAASLPAGIRLERQLAAGDAAVMADPTQVHQVVMNLCANAIQAMKSNGVLTVVLDRIDMDTPNCATCRLKCGNYLRLAVRDKGSGIAAAVLERIFDPFFTTKEVGVGTGLGLSLVHGIVTDLGGGIDVESRVGEGSTFTVFLPLHNGVAAPIVVNEAAVQSGQGQTILLVDDEEALVRLGEEMIAELGYEPVGFTSSSAALDEFSAEPQRFDAVLSDEAMPEVTGSELAIEIRRIRPDIPIVLMSGYVTPALTARARDAGVVEVLAKPLTSGDISRSLASALQG
jgi:PAS domain S-box-containing protein